MDEEDEALGRGTDEKIGCINKGQQNLSLMKVILAKAGKPEVPFHFRPGFPPGRRPAGVYPVLLKRGRNDVQKDWVEFP